MNDEEGENGEEGEKRKEVVHKDNFYNKRNIKKDSDFTISFD